MPSVYDKENFQGRVSLAALYISEGRETTRSFDTCFEMNDGNAVAVALLRRATANPDGKLALNLWRYLGREAVERTAHANAHRKNMAGWARELRGAAEARFARRHENAQTPAVAVGQLGLF